MVTEPKTASADIRNDLADLATELLLGPLDPAEVLEAAPTDTYLTGVLWPRDTRIEADEDTGELAGESGEDGPGDSAVPGYRAVRPCSLGITFAVDAASTLHVGLGSTARYVPLATEDSDREASRGTDRPPPLGRWQRVPLGYSVRFPADMPPIENGFRAFLRADGSQVEDPWLFLHVRHRRQGALRVLTLTLLNTAPVEDSSPRDLRCLLQSEIVVRAEGGAIRARPLPAFDNSDEDAAAGALLYRDVREYAVGHGVAAIWDTEWDGGVIGVSTAWMPRVRVEGMSAEGHPSLGVVRARHPSLLQASFLACVAARAEVVAALGDFVACYEAWIDGSLRARLDDLALDLQPVGIRHASRCGNTADRLRAGICLLAGDDTAWAAFTLANAAMDRQARFPARGTNARPLVWRPFQLGFLLLVLPGLVDPKAPSRACMDLLWFPTGGGKTEAYLGLTAFQIFHRRLSDQGRRQLGGVDVLMRYTLRLLTIQQFQRAAALITACELIRQEDGRLGSAPITLGLFVGGEATPNHMDDAREALDKERQGERPSSTPRQLLRCPVCGNELPAAAYVADPVSAEIRIICTAEECETGGRPLPVQTVDAVIHSRPPSLLIGTVDKFAQLPRSSEIRSIFNLDRGSPPGLIVQDELHLISGPLGSIAGLYETVIDLLCTDRGVRPKIVGSTATIGRAADQVRALFDRDVLQFPPPGLDAGDSFFAVRDNAGPDRLYMGVSTAGRSPKFALQALVATLLQAAAAHLERGEATAAGIDPFWTCVAYFNSLRELGGAYVLMQDDVPRQMHFLAARLAATIRPLELPPQELSSRQSSRDLPKILQELECTLQDHRADPLAHAQPMDTVLASNMISVGVDVSRLGLMVVNGQPKSTAEYIQATSRVGRNRSGLVISLSNFGRPRDLSHFEHFTASHRALYRSVEATSVTPWAPRARDKALHAVLAAAVRHHLDGMGGEEAAGRLQAGMPGLQALVDGIVARAALATGGLEEAETRAELNALIAEWARRSHASRDTGRPLRYWGTSTAFGKTGNHLMRSAEEAARRAGPAWPTPNTMREVEPSAAFVLKRIASRKES